MPTGAEVEYSTPCVQQMVTVCSPGYEYGVHCKEVEHQTCYNTPTIKKVVVEQTVVYPDPVDTCVQNNIQLPR